jgi:signal transduction histidine kinase
VLVPLVAALVGLAGALAATLALHRAAAAALDRVLEERLRGAGETAAALLDGRTPSAEALREIMEANRLDGAYVVGPGLVVLADATGPAGVRADLLRVDAGRVEDALQGRATVGRAYDVGSLAVETAYFPLRAADGAVPAVLALEAGRAFLEARTGLARALGLGIGLACAGALALAVVAARWSRAERQRSEGAALAARGEAISRMAAMVAHEIRNPLGIIRAAVELVRERAGPALPDRDRERLQDVLGEVERLRRLTEDFLELAAERPPGTAEVDLGDVAAEAARGSAALHPGLEVHLDVPPSARVTGEAGRLRQVLANLLSNAAQAGARRAEIVADVADGEVRLRVRDDGPGIPPELGERLFDPFATARAGGTGLGLAVSRRIVERYGGTLRLERGGEAGATFELRLPRRDGRG